jgi:hypothetical protein
MLSDCGGAPLSGLSCEKENDRERQDEGVGSDVLLAHGLDAEGESDLDLTGPDLVRDHGHGHESAGAEAVDHLNGHALWEASSEGSTTSVVDGVGCQNGADTNVAYARGVDVGVGDGLLW